ncbi:MAG: substrate-binding domain-containing protein [Emticicia sp.]|nr:substrate-binding domain-containing protein [Emticicia sp.]
MVSCTKCERKEGIVKSGFLRGKQRYHCKDCGIYFTLEFDDITRNNRTHQVTIIDIAKLLGVAPSTVSRALNNKSEINANTRQEILRVANELDYKPNLLAQSLNSGETHTIGVIIPNIERPFFAGVLAGIQEVASNSGYRVMICQSNESHQTEIQNIQALITSRVDGLLLSHSKETNTYDHIRPYVDKRMPIVHFDRVCNELHTSKVILEDFKGSFDLVEHLILQGCKRVAIVIGPQQLLICKTRLEGYKAALQKNGFEIDEALIFQGSFKKDDSIRAFAYFMSLPNPPDGIFAMFYQNAIEMMVQAKKADIKIPRELAFVGFGGELIAELFEPSLTVFQQFPFLIGETAARIILQNIATKENFVPYTQTVRGELIIRDSSLKSNC